MVVHLYVSPVVLLRSVLGVGQLGLIGSSFPWTWMLLLLIRKCFLSVMLFVMPVQIKPL